MKTLLYFVIAMALLPYALAGCMALIVVILEAAR